MNAIDSKDTQSPDNGTPSSSIGMIDLPVDAPPSQLLKIITEECIASSFPLAHSEEECVSMIVESYNQEIQMRNDLFEKSRKRKFMTEIPPKVIAMLIAARDDVALVSPGDKSNQTGREKFLSTEEKSNLPIGIYQEFGANEGVWELTNSPHKAFGIMVEKYKFSATRREKEEVFTYVKTLLRVVKRCTIPHYVPVNNGIVDVLNKKLLPFSPDLVFTSKIHTDLNPFAVNPFIQIPEDGTTWDVDSWFLSLGTPTFVESIKEVIQAACLPLASQDKMCLFYSQVGNNGKGTICRLIRNLLGEEVTVSIPINNFSKRFGLSNLPGAMAIITDENDVSSFNQGLATLKAVITADEIPLERKHQDPFDFTFYGLVLQCINDMPKVDDKTASFRRRLHFITFEQCFTGQQKRYIKDRLIYRNDVLEYILKMVLFDMPYRDSFTETPETQAALRLYTIVTNSVVAFLDEILPECKWDLLPATDFLYEIYKKWYKKVAPSGKIIGRNDFIDGVKSYIDNNNTDEWEWTDCTRSHGYIRGDVREPLLVEYDLRAFQNETCAFNSSQRKYVYEWNLKEKYSGLKRRNVTPAVAQGTSNNT